MTGGLTIELNHARLGWCVVATDVPGLTLVQDTVEQDFVAQPHPAPILLHNLPRLLHNLEGCCTTVRAVGVGQQSLFDEGDGAG